MNRDVSINVMYDPTGSLPRLVIISAAFYVGVKFGSARTRYRILKAANELIKED